VLAYDIYKDRILIGQSHSAAFTVTGCKCDTTATITIIARDAAGNRSNISSPLPVKTLACKITGLIPAWDFESLEIVPNPATNYLTLKGASGSSDVKIYSSTGVLAAQYTNIQSDLDISALSAGNYLVKVTAENSTRVFKVCKMK